MKIKKSTFLPAILLIYLFVMAYIGRDLLFAGEYVHYFSVFGVSLIVIVILHFTLKKREKMKERQDSQDKITIMAKTPKYTIDIGSVPDNIIALIRPVMNRPENHFVFINDSHISGSKGLNYSLSLDIGWYA